MQSMTYGNGHVINYSYNDKYLLTQKRSGDTVIAEYKYDTRGNVIELDDRSAGVVYTYEYDQLNRAVAVTGSDGTRYSVSYDDKARVSLKVYEIAGTTDIEGTTFTQGYKYNSANLISSSQFNGQDVANYAYDSALRLKSKKLNIDNPYNVKYNYIRYSDGQLSSLIGSIQNGDNTLSYTYDELGNIATVSENGTLLEAYEYDKLNQLTKVTSGSDVYEYSYDNGGNILSVTKNGTAVKTYGYDAAWCDKLTSYNGAAITYDEIGNPLKYYNGDSFTWQNGRQLHSLRNSAYGYIAFTYDDSGKRTKKNYYGIDTCYYYDGDKIVSSTYGVGRLDYFYGADGTPEGFVYTNNYATKDNGTYYYVKNAQGDILKILNEAGETVVEYSYDVWGKTSVVKSTSNLILNANPFRYRGYVYDYETGYYYLNSRYYDPEIGRFINADGAISSVGGDIRGYNLFSYCFNNPINMDDPTGNWPKWVKSVASTIMSTVKKAVATVVKKVKSITSAVKGSNVTKLNPVGLPKEGKPDSSQTLPNADGTPKQKRWYGPDGNAIRDRDYNHPGEDIPFPHDHEWKDGQRQKEHLDPSPEFEFSWEPIIGIGIVTICAVGIIVVAVDNITGVGFGDDFLFAPLGAGLSKGLTMIF